MANTAANTSGIAKISRQRIENIKWPIVCGIIFMHAGSLLAPWTFTWSALWVFMALQFATGMLGITLCYHRLLAHRSFQTPRWLEYILTLLGSLALQGGPIQWVAAHRVHHAFSDREEDPHSPKRGFWWAHMFWLFARDSVLDQPSVYRRYAMDLCRDKVHIWIERSQLLQAIILAVLLYVWGGLPFLVWGFFFRTVFVYHATWLVNSAAHLWGYQTYDTNEGSRNNWLVAAITYGEGWHNNHHAYMYSAAHGLRWWEIDITYCAIRLLRFIRLASRVRLPEGSPCKLHDARSCLKHRLPTRIPKFSISAST